MYIHVCVFIYMRMFVVAKTKTINNLKVYHHETDENTGRNITQLLKIMSSRKTSEESMISMLYYIKNVSWRVMHMILFRRKNK